MADFQDPQTAAYPNIEGMEIKYGDPKRGRQAPGALNGLSIRLLRHGAVSVRIQGLSRLKTTTKGS